MLRIIFAMIFVSGMVPRSGLAKEIFLKSDKSNYAAQLATAKAGDIVQFADGKRVRIVRFIGEEKGGTLLVYGVQEEFGSTYFDLVLPKIAEPGQGTGAIKELAQEISAHEQAAKVGLPARKIRSFLKDNYALFEDRQGNFSLRNYMINPGIYDKDTRVRARAGLIALAKDTAHLAVPGGVSLDDIVFHRESGKWIVYHPPSDVVEWTSTTGTAELRPILSKFVSPDETLRGQINLRWQYSMQSLGADIAHVVEKRRSTRIGRTIITVNWCLRKLRELAAEPGVD